MSRSIYINILQDIKEYNQHTESVKSFKEFFLPLLTDKASRAQYFNEEYEEEFGDMFIAHLKKLMIAFLRQLDSHLPKSKLEQVCLRLFFFERFLVRQEFFY